MFQPIPAMAAPSAPDNNGTITSVPNVGSRPLPLGTLTLPGQSSSTTSTVSPVSTSTNPVVQEAEKRRAEISVLGDQLIRIGQDRDLAQTQVTTASQKVTQAQEALRQAQADAAAAASAAVQAAAALPPGALDSGLLDLDTLARVQRGDGLSDEAAARHLSAARDTLQVALADQVTATGLHADLSAQWTTLNTQITTKQADLQKYETTHAGELTAAETSASAADQQLSTGYLAGETAGRSADPRALQALQYALAQRGDPYVWSEEGPDEFDCSGLMYAAYRGVGFPLVRVSRDQYYQTRNKVVDRYSLLPGDLLFFSSSSSWTGIHHVAMYAGDGMMVEAPRTGLNVRLTPVRWSRLFQATRVFGSVEGVADNPVLGSPDPDEPATSPTTAKPSPSSSKTTSPPASPSPSKTTNPPASPSPSKTTNPPSSPSPSKTTNPPPSSSSPTPEPSESSSEPKPTAEPSESSAAANPSASASSAAASSAAASAAAASSAAASSAAASSAAASAAASSAAAKAS
ncbi:C40 family peptidase [Actinoplanes rectilineatus]|uniref:C40 family peptidase n=1 Tax=Actinoplanes rectilineatus TaxID=113571 RepID=UPI001FE01D83|nr:NlpC/P60 family protein [Actinoplanes rectilineatus]